MRVFDNGKYRDATPEEIAEWEKQEPAPRIPTDAERIDALEEAIRKGMSL